MLLINVQRAINTLLQPVQSNRSAVYLNSVTTQMLIKMLLNLIKMFTYLISSKSNQLMKISKYSLLQTVYAIQSII